MGGRPGRGHSAASVPALALAALVTAACSSDDAPIPVNTIVAGSPLEIAADAQLSLGVADGDSLQEFDRVITPFLMDDGRVGVPLEGDQVIRLFDGSGVYLTSYGRAGSGPGEFRDLTWAWARGDTIEALDGRLRRITRFLPDGSIAVIGIQTELRDLSYVCGQLGDGWLVSGVSNNTRVGRDQVAFHHIARDGTDIGEMVTVGGYTRYYVPGLGGGPEPLSPRPTAALGGNRLYVGQSELPVIRVLDDNASTVDSITWTASFVEVPARLLQDVIDSAVAKVPSERQAALRARYEAATQTDGLSLYWKMLVDSEGFVWIKPYDPFVNSFVAGARVGPGGTWRVFAPDGTETISVMMPAEIEPVQITKDAVVGIARDANGVEAVRVHALRRRM